MHDQMQRDAAEMSILGAMLLDKKVLDVLTMIPAITAGTFWSDAHRKIYDSMVAIHKRKRAVDLVTLRDELEQRGELEAIGGVEYLADLLDYAPGLGKKG